MRVDLSTYDNGWYKPGNTIKRLIWYFFNISFLMNPLNPFSGLKKGVLRMFGAKIGKGVLIKPHVSIKYPWFLEIGEYSWVGEGVWIDNLGKVKIGSHVCISQGAMLISGNHNYKKPGFDLIVDEITIEDGVWIGVKSIVPGGSVCRTHSVLLAGSIASGELASWKIYRGNPAMVIRDRKPK